MSTAEQEYSKMQSSGHKNTRVKKSALKTKLKIKIIYKQVNQQKYFD